jgi:protein-S-isoprenylcysteine O-methyltransferase Ste14
VSEPPAPGTTPAPLPGSPATGRRVVRRPRHPLVTALLALTVTVFDGLLLALALGGLGALLNHPRALALLAVWATAGVTLALLHPVRSQDTVAEERDPAWRLALLFFLPLLIPPVAAWGERAGMLLLPPGDGLRWTGVGLAAFGLALRVLAMATLGTRFAPIPAVQREHPVEERGVYRRIRHPGYLGAWMAALGAVLAFGNNLALPLLILFAALLAARARHEEVLLERHLGDSYRAYRARTGAFLPRLGR